MSAGFKLNLHKGNMYKVVQLKNCRTGDNALCVKQYEIEFFNCHNLKKSWRSVSLESGTYSSVLVMGAFVHPEALNVAFVNHDSDHK